jgi:two-component system cell cycle response regulator
MTALVQAALTLRRSARASLGHLAVVMFGLLVALGPFRDRDAIGLEHALLACSWLAVALTRGTSRARATGVRPTTSLDLELALLMLPMAHGLLQMFGGLLGPFYPGLYVLVAFVAAVAERSVSGVFVLVAIGYEALLFFVTEGQTDPKPFALHAAFLTLFGLLSAIFTQVEITRVRRENERELADEKRRVSDDARMFRLVTTPSEAHVADETRLTRSSVEEVRQALYFNLDLLKRTMQLHTCVLLMADARSSEKSEDDKPDPLRIAELATDSDHIASGPFAPGAGAVGAAYQRGVTMMLEHLRDGYGGICYYQRPSAVRAFIAVPVRENGHTRGVLCADRLEDRPFTPAEEQVLAASIAHLLRALENERLFVQLERSKREHAVLHKASQGLGAAQDEPAVLEAALSAAAEIAPYDFAAVTCYDAESRTHSVRRAVGERAHELHNLSFRDNTSLTAMAVKNRHYLPYRGELDAASQVVYTRKHSLSGMQSLIILPLVVRDTAIGTLALAAARRDAFGSNVRPTLTVLANQLAVALSNAASVKRLEELATTDGLTGCFNKRYFNEQLRAKLSAAERFERKLSLVITDIDHFKGVNDTYGHAAGDAVIRELGAILIRLKRETDVVARFGGEEFCILCEETGAEGAMQLAERVREELAATSFETELGKLQVTCSLGVATYPEHAKTREALFEGADRALYRAKHGGRNRVDLAEEAR